MSSKTVKDKSYLIIAEDLRRLEERLYNDTEKLRVQPLTPVKPEMLDEIRRFSAKMAARMLISVRAKSN